MPPVVNANKALAVNRVPRNEAKRYALVRIPHKSSERVSSLSSFTRRARLRTDMNPDQARAEALFKKEQQRHEGEKAMAEARAAQEALRIKTARLRALRLARDAARQDTH